MNVSVKTISLDIVAVAQGRENNLSDDVQMKLSVLHKYTQHATRDAPVYMSKSGFSQYGGIHVCFVNFALAISAGYT